MSLIYENKVPASYRVAFIAKVILVAKNLGIPANWLMAIINWESGGKFTASVTNAQGYTGLIQFGVAAATDLGTTTLALRNMTEVQQLDYVEAYYKMWYKSLKITAPKSYGDVYLITLYPVAANKPDDFVLGSNPTVFANNNPAFKYGKNYVTAGDVRKYMLNAIPDTWKKEFLTKK
jgi:hypothetical protein